MLRSQFLWVSKITSVPPVICIFLETIWNHINTTMPHQHPPHVRLAFTSWLEMLALWMGMVTGRSGGKRGLPCFRTLFERHNGLWKFEKLNYSCLNRKSKGHCWSMLRLYDVYFLLVTFSLWTLTANCDLKQPLEPLQQPKTGMKNPLRWASLALHRVTKPCFHSVILWLCLYLSIVRQTYIYRSISTLWIANKNNLLDLLPITLVFSSVDVLQNSKIITSSWWSQNFKNSWLRQTPRILLPSNQSPVD